MSLATMFRSDVYHMGHVPVSGQRVRGATITCGRCGAQASTPVNTFKKTSGNDNDHVDAFIRRKFEKMGWQVGKTQPIANRCPGCFAAIKTAAINKSYAKKQETIMPTAPTLVIPPPPKSESTAPAPERTMSREDRRIIFEKLNEVYLNETAGYGEDWTDAKVAKDLGVPRSWVIEIRDLNFGPEGSNGEIRAGLEKATALLQEITELAARFDSVSNDLKRLTGTADLVQKQMADIQRKVS